MNKHAEIKEQHEAVMQEQQQLRNTVNALPPEQLKMLTELISKDPELVQLKEGAANAQSKLNALAVYTTKDPQEHEAALDKVAQWLVRLDDIHKQINARVKQHLTAVTTVQASVPERITYHGATYIKAGSDKAYNILEAIYKKVDGLEMEAYKAWEAARQDRDEDYATRAEIVRLSLHLIESLLTSQHAAVGTDAERLLQLTNKFYAREKDSK